MKIFPLNGYLLVVLPTAQDQMANGLYLPQNTDPTLTKGVVVEVCGSPLVAKHETVFFPTEKFKGLALRDPEGRVQGFLKQDDVVAVVREA